MDNRLLGNKILLCSISFSFVKIEHKQKKELQSSCNLLDNDNLDYHIFRHNPFRVYRNVPLHYCKFLYCPLRNQIVCYRKFPFYQILYHKRRTAQVSERNLLVL